MKKIIFYISIIVALIFLVNISNILITDFHRLNEFGYGYLTGEIILMLIFGFIAFYTRKKSTKN